VVVATDAIGMGMNLPIRRVVFLESEKFDGMTKRPLRTEEILQIGGRAGRRGLYDIGYVNAEFRKNLIRNAFRSAPEPIEKVALPFPESLLGLDGSLSDIFTRWGAIQQKNDAFNQTDLSVEIKLCRFLEQKTDDKELIYKFITMPFDEDNINLFMIWEEMADCEIEHDVFDYRRFIPEVLNTSYNAEDLSFLEENYQVCDLLCYYLTRFGLPEEYEEVSEARSDIAVKIMEVLSKQELVKRKCRSCGKQIKLNSPYNICSECYEKHMRSPFYGGY
jgi:ATP-dependent RNA helicase SUPV3L1/SUV3